MRATLPDELPLICPACRKRTAEGREMHTVTLIAGLPSDPAHNEIEEGVLACVNPACGRRYPVIAGIPILIPQLGEYLRTEVAAVVEGELSPLVAAVLAEAGPDGEPYARMLEHLSTYIDAHWGDCVEPAADGPAPQFGFASIANRVAGRSEAPVGRAIELGCGLGRGLAELARSADLAVGVDWSFGSLKRARRLLLGKSLAFARRSSGRHYRVATVRPGERAAHNVALICGDALDPPVAPGAFARVAALNLLDNVRRPRQLLSVLDGLCEPGGELLLATPYAWQSAIVDEGERIGGSDPASALKDLLTSGKGLEAPYQVHEEATLRWWLRRDSRSAAVYDCHWLRAHKGY